MNLISDPLRSTIRSFKYVHFLACIWLLAASQVAAQQIRAHSEMLGASGSLSFPEKVVVGPDRSIYFLDTTLSRIFVQDVKTGTTNALCESEAVRFPSDISMDAKGQLWVLTDNGSRILKLNRQCAVRAEIKPPQLTLRIGTNAFGEVVALHETGPSLFSLFSGQGKLLRSFGERIIYQEEIATNELSDGHIVADNSGGFFFSFNYPPLIRHYGRTGRLLNEFKPESDIPIAPPNISVRTAANSVSVNSRYQILVLDMAADANGRLYLLMSGKNKVPALTQGTPKLIVINTKGRVLKTLTLEHSFHRVIATANGNLFLLRNRPPLRLDRYVVF